MPLSSDRVYRLSDIHEGSNVTVTVATGIKTEKIKDPDLGHPVDLYAFVSNTPSWEFHSFIGTDSSETGDTVDVPDADDSSLIHRFEPLTMDLWKEMGPYVLNWKAASKNFASDEEIQNFFLQDLQSSAFEPDDKGPNTDSEDTEQDLEEGKKPKKIKTAVSIPVSPSAAEAGVPIGTIHVWSDGNKHQKQTDGSWVQLGTSNAKVTSKKDLIATHPQFQPVAGKHADDKSVDLPDDPVVTEPVAGVETSKDAPSETPEVSNTGSEPEPEPDVEVPKEDVWIDKAEGLPTDSQASYSKMEGEKRVYSPERQALHNIIEESLLKGFTPAVSGTMPVAVLTMGLPASGKSHKVSKLWAGQNVAFIDSDRVKEFLPDYQIAVKQHARNAGTIVHKESTDVADQLLHKATKSKLNFVLEGVGKDLNWYSQLIANIRKEGYYIYAVMQHVSDLPKLMARAEERGRRNGRFIPESELKQPFASLPKNFRAIDRLVHSSIITNGDTLDSKPFYERHEGKEPLVHDPAAYDDFRKLSESLLFRVFLSEVVQPAPHLPASVDISTIKSVYGDILKISKSEENDPVKYDVGNGVNWPLSDR